MASGIKTEIKAKRKDRRIVRESSMLRNKAGYKAQLKKDLKDIQQKFSRVLGKDLDKSDNPIVEAISPVKSIEGSVLVDLCMQRSGKRGGGGVTPQNQLIDFITPQMDVLSRLRDVPSPWHLLPDLLHHQLPR